MKVGIFITAIIFFGQSYAIGCNVCHSKNPKMVKMHKELEYKDCFKCHGPTAVKSLEERKKQREADIVCGRCHKK
ncbi:MAG: hypothetical protein HY754_14360 [Nitrospirae bacterium]|nr:hypothetical protein [Nitrospirota bacterium]